MSESILTEEKQKRQKIILKNEANIQVDTIDLSMFRSNETYKFLISNICESYKLSYEISETALSKIWGEKTSRINRAGTFFRIGDEFSRSVDLNGVIYTGTSYYLLSQTKISDLPFIKIEETFFLSTSNSLKWNIYKIQFTKITRDSAKYAKYHHVQLLEKPPELIPLWPPSIQKNQ